MLSYLGRTFVALRIRNFAIMWTGSLFGITAFFMSTLVNAIVAFDLTGKNSSVGIVMLGQGVAMLAFGPVGGAFADRVAKRRMVMICQSVIGSVFLSFALLTVTDLMSIAYLTLGSFIIGTMFAFMGPANQAWIVELVGLSQRANAVALNQVSMNAARIVGPAAGGIIVGAAFFGSAGAYFIMAGLEAIVVSSLFLLPASKGRANSTRSVFGDLFEGISYVKGHPRLRAMILLFALVIMWGLSYVTILPGLLENEFNMDSDRVGPLQAVGAAGGLIASIAVAPLAGSQRALVVYSTMGLAFAASLALLGLSPNFAISFVPMFIIGLSSGAFQTLNSAVIVTESDPAYYGRVMSLTMLAFSGFMIAGWPLGLLADAVGERATFGVMAVVTGASVLLFAPIIARARAPQASPGIPAEQPAA